MFVKPREPAFADQKVPIQILVRGTGNLSLPMYRIYLIFTFTIKKNYCINKLLKLCPYFFTTKNIQLIPNQIIEREYRGTQINYIIDNIITL